MDYHKLKEASAQEVSLLMDAINEIRNEQEKQIKAAKSGHGDTTIGL